MTNIRHYFSLQFIMLKRQLADFGIHPIVGFVIAAVVFFWLSVALFSYTRYAPYLYPLIATAILFKHGEADRNDFLRLTFSKAAYFKIRVIENLLTAFPFIVFLAFKAQLYPMLLLILTAIGITLLHIKNSFSLAIPTPFYKKPFEFIAGFRSAVLAFPLAYFITAMSIIYQNLNLGLFSLLFIFLVCLSFYNQPEDIHTVWVHKQKANVFLFAKIKTAIVFSSLLTLPVLLALLLFFHVSFPLILGAQVVGYIYLMAAILAKYAAFPQSINLPQALLLGASVLMPPLLLAIIPFFYLQSQKRLKEILE